MATKASRNPIDVYLAGLESPAARRTLTALRKQLRRLLPTATETLSYGMPAYRMPSGKVAAGFAFFGRNCGYYPHSGNVVPRLGAALAGLKTTKGGVTFAPEEQLPAAAVRALVTARLAEIGDGEARVRRAPAKRAPAKRAAAKRASARTQRAGATSASRAPRGRASPRRRSPSA